ncbi:PREDICTED: uncharacterized protein LOC105568522 isoform X2 [Vollenhovia emeryi]|uniref:uncharacterized protein LOC105568522 isoform X2 n=1 Tax=Vollenhovia emeryi TaxID=411798 RepID=UPI0005F4DCB5|nr:PREDICTED: uncharacterized protein LOC105568522 isoform X2 [Vollenhovia emeryi]
MSRPILSRPRTFIYGSNYDKGESYYKPMVDHLDRKYSGRPLFPEPRNSLADEIAARRSDSGSRNLSGNRDDYYDELDFLLDGRGRPIQEDPYENDFVITQRRFKERAAAAFEEDLAELRRKRRDMQDRVFDVIDLNAEIEKAKSTLEAADIVFQRHATKFDNQGADDEQTMSLAQRLDRTRKIANVELEKPRPKTFLIKWPKMPVDEPDAAQPTAQTGRQRRINSLIDTSEIGNPLETLAMQPIKRRFMKRKKSVSF